MALNILAKEAYVNRREEAQFKLWGMVGALGKYKITGLRKGYCKENELWVMRATKLVVKIMEST